MRVFISYAREDREFAARVNSALNAAGFETFLDIKNLPPGEEFNARISTAVERADLFIYLASRHSTRPGSFALTELSFAEAKWKNPSGYVLPVIMGGLDASDLPAYIRPINALLILGNLEAEVVAWVKRRVSEGSLGTPGIMSPQERLSLWARSARPPLQKPVIDYILYYLSMIGSGIIVLIVGILIALYVTDWQADLLPDWSFNDFVSSFFLYFPLIIILLAFFLIIYNSIRIVGIKGEDKSPVPALVLDRIVKEKERMKIILQLADGSRVELWPFYFRARDAFPGDFGWAYIEDDCLIYFQSSKSDSIFN